MSHRLTTPPRLVATALCCAVSVTAGSGAAAVEQKRSYNLPSGDAATTLNQFAGASGQQIVFMMEKVKGERTNAVAGDYAARDALDRMLAGTGLNATRDPATGAFVVSRKRTAESKPRTGEVGPVSDPQPKPPAKPVKNPPRTLLAALAGWLALGSTAGAQTTTTTPRNEETVVLSPFEITGAKDRGWYATNSLSATRFNTPLSELPLTINVVTSEFIEAIGATNLAEAVRYSTGIIAGASGPTQGGAGTNFSESFTIRGLPVRFVFRDGTRNWRGNEPLFMDRVEVLKGPTAILYGESLPGGTLNYITKMPQFTAGGSAGLQVDSFGSYRGNVEATGPLGASGKAAYLFAAGYQAGGGFIENMEQEYKPFLASLMLKPWLGTKLYLGMESLNRHIDGQQTNGTLAWRGPLNQGSVNPLSRGTGQPSGINPNAKPGSNPWGDPVLGAYFDQRVSNYTATLEQNLGKNLDLRSSWNYAKTPQENLGSGNNDTNVIDAPLVDPITKAAIIAAPGDSITYLGNRFVIGQGSTLAGNAISGATAGAYQGGIQRAAAYTAGPGAGPVRFVGNNLSRPTFFDPNVVGPRPFSYSGNENREMNWKTDLTYKFDVGSSTHRVLFGYELYRGSYRNYRTVSNPNWSGNNADGQAGNIAGNYVQDIFGNRWTKPAAVNNAFAPGADVSRDGGDSYYGSYLGQFFDKRLNLLGGFRTADLFVSDFNSSVRNHFKKTVPQGGVLYKVVDGLGAYASYSKSFRLNNERFTINAPAASNPGAYTPAASFPPQEGKGVDFGIKFELFGQQLSGNLPRFEIDYTEIPITSATILDDKGNFVRFPGGAQKSEGEELELFYTPNRNFQLTGGITRVDASYTKVTRGQEYLLGQKLATTAKWQTSAFARYIFDSGHLKGFSLGGGGYYLGDGAQGDLPRTPPKNYTVFDAVLGYEHTVAGLNVKYALNVTNVFDKDHYQDFTNPYPPRTFTFSARVKF
jgi:outer membrane receptor protein involved in Fe transport